ncbi:MAG: class I SAM-dependent methyltransferase [Candidatus Heimdallarchaeota archaeon]
MTLRPAKQQKGGYVIKTLREKGAETIEGLKREGGLDQTREVVADGEFLWIPVKKKMKGAKKRVMPQKKMKHLRKSLKEKFGLKAFDVIGEIIVLFLPRELEEKAQEIGEYLLKLYPKVKAVYKEVGKTKGTFRVQQKKLLAGSGSETIHTEHGLKFKLDVTEVFFSPRQLTERLQITKFVKKGERVCVFFSGIGAIPIYLAKYTEAKEIIGIELNKKAHDYALQNVKLNKIEPQRVQLINDDVRKVARKWEKEKRTFSLVILAEPKNERSMFQEAKTILREKTGRILLSFVGTKAICERRIAEIEKEGFIVKKIFEKKRLGPRESRYLLQCQ